MTTDTVTAMLRAGLVATLAMAALCLGSAAVLGGGPAVWGALLGTSLVLVSSGLGMLALRAGTRLDPALLVVVAMATYAVKVIALGAVFAAVVGVGLLDAAVDRTAVGLSVIACTIAWTAGELRAAMRTREPTYRLERAGVR